MFRVNIGNVKEGEKWTYVLINLITKIEPKIFLTYVATLMFLFKSDLLIRLAIMKRQWFHNMHHCLLWIQVEIVVGLHFV